MNTVAAKPYVRGSNEPWKRSGFSNTERSQRRHLRGSVADGVRFEQYAERFGVAESEKPLVIANAYFRLAILANAELFGLDVDDLGKRMMQVIKDAGRE